jgi:hypothetical protein
MAVEGADADAGAGSDGLERRVLAFLGEGLGGGGRSLSRLRCASARSARAGV